MKTFKITQNKRSPVKKSFLTSLRDSLAKKKENFNPRFTRILYNNNIDNKFFEELEEELLVAGIGMDTINKIIVKLKKRENRIQLQDTRLLRYILKHELQEILQKAEKPFYIENDTPFVILMIGVNGVGKTTTIGKLAYQLRKQSKSVMLAAGDTFRVAAAEQLQIWGDKTQVEVIAKNIGTDPVSVICDAMQVAKKKAVDILIIDTSGRLQNKSYLMDELKRIVRVTKKINKKAPHEVMLIIDSSTGVNAMDQVKSFHEAVGVTGITISKLDTTAKGGVIFTIADQFPIPIRYIGTGEHVEDLHPFNPADFVECFLPELSIDN